MKLGKRVSVMLILFLLIFNIINLVKIINIYSVSIGIADSFGFPLKNVAWDNSDFSKWTKPYDCYHYHLAADVLCNYYTPVYACANGVVKNAENSHDGVSHARVVMEHALPDGSYVCSVYYHLDENALNVVVGQTVQKGDLLGYIVTVSVNHLHFGIVSNKYNSVNIDYNCIGSAYWRYSGYHKWTEVLSMWCSPQDFIELYKNGFVAPLNIPIKITESGYVNVRSGPSTSYQIVAYVYNNQAFVAFEKKLVGSYYWYHIWMPSEYGRAQGWIRSDLVQEDFSLPQIEVNTTSGAEIKYTSNGSIFSDIYYKQRFVPYQNIDGGYMFYIPTYIPNPNQELRLQYPQTAWVNSSYVNYYQGNPNNYTLTVNVSPSGSGTVTLSPSGGTYLSGTVVTMTASPSTGYHFVNWSGDITGTSNPITITMNSNKNVTTNFEVNPVGEPKSIHTWLDGPYGSNIYSYDIDLRIDNFPNNPDPNWLYFWALCVYFNDGSAAHGGLQWASGGEKANWGDYGLVGGIQSHVVNYNWETGKWYRYRAWRLSQQPDGSWAWGFWILDYSTGIDTYIDSVTSYGSVINDVLVFTETGYGVICDTSMQVSWRSPNYNSISGGTGITPTSGKANYNGTCSNPCNTDQRLISTNPIQFIHITNTTRITELNTYLFQISATSDFIGVYRPSDRRFYMRSSTGTVSVISFGITGDTPIIGDWNGDNIDEIGVYRPSDRRFYMRSSTGTVSVISFGITGDTPIIGDWNGDNIDEIGVYRPSDRRFYMRSSTVTVISFGITGDTPIIGKWSDFT